MTNTENLHAHVSTSMTDCDGRMDRDWVAMMNDDEVASEFGDLEFQGRMLTNLVSWSEPSQTNVTPFEDGTVRIEVSYAHDEGMFWGEALTCTDDCPETSSQRDHQAEAAGY